MKKRLDQILVENNLCESREKAKRLILAGSVKVDGILNPKPGQQLSEDVEIEVKEPERFVGRGGYKLEGALDAFGYAVEGQVAVDVGASTGGFTDCLLQRGAKRVYTFDVGTNQLAWKLRQDERVIARERCNVRYLQPEEVPEAVDLAVIDVSFISLTLILGPTFALLKPGGSVICLIKPQFELARDEVGKGGIVRDEALRLSAVEKIKRFVSEAPAKEWRGLVESPISGADGNREYLAWIRDASA